MANPRFPKDFPFNPNYGKGIFRRRIKLLGSAEQVVAELEDCNHGFRSTVQHNGQRVTGIVGESIRFPLTTCGGATDKIEQLVGIGLDADLKALAQKSDPKMNCTHLYDLTVLAIQHALRGEDIRLWDVVIPDEVDNFTEASVSLNGELILKWGVGSWSIVDGDLKGKSLGSGFGQWAARHYLGLEREAAFILQKGYFVSNARRADMSQLQGKPVTETEQMSGVCYSYSPEVVVNAVRTMNATRDFTETEAQLLKFI
ncbi:DUF2889 domain-containing protein [Halioxenophilus sp. WMMB6]|uniref:DUF2889 domain-containing protein n=1 Tax=Halioxenophilus sp. WMMB6 TaxID=3073815 RepID=UPI00295E8051|nr:DUF2889 domain-containing protein [Halioxenophilus sp. WMMB6]